MAQVLRCDDAQARQDIEIMSNEFMPWIIRFTQDGAGVWFITYTVYNDPHFVTIRPYIDAHCVDYTYVPPPDDL